MCSGPVRVAGRELFLLPRGNTRPLPAQLAPFLTGTGTDPVDLKAMVVGSQVSIDLRQSIVKMMDTLVITSGGCTQ